MRPVTITERVLGLAAPSIVFLLSGFGVQTVAIVFISRLGQLQLSAAVLASSVFNTTGLSLVYGLAGGMDTLCGQAYGAKNFPMMGEVTQRAMLINLAVALPVIACWTRMAPMLVALGQSKEIAPLAAKYMLLSCPQLLFTVVTVAVEKFQTTQVLVAVQNIMNAVTAVNLTVFAVCPLLFWFFTHRVGWGLTGAAIANNTTSGLAMVAMIASTIWIQQRYSRDDPRRHTWSGFTAKAFARWGEYLKLGVPACAMTCLEWWLYEVAMILSGLLSNPQMALSVSGICSQIVSLAFMVPLGVSIALRIRVSNMLGAGKPNAAMNTITTGLAITATFLLVLLAVLLGFRSQIAHLFLPYAAPGSAEVHALRDCILIIAAGAVCDWCNCTLAGALQGAGRQALGAKIYGFTYWCIGACLLWLLPFRLGWGVRGIWAALSIASTIQCVFMAVAISTLDWQKEAQQAYERVAPSERSVSNASTEAAQAEPDNEAGQRLLNDSKDA